jgi:hypothetical protein
MQNDISRFLELTDKVLCEEDKMAIGFNRRAENRAEFDNSISENGAALIPFHNRVSDDEIVFFFEDREDAESLYNFYIESGLLEAGEVTLRNDGGQSSVAFMPHVAIQKPEMLHAALLAYEDQMYFDSVEDEATFEEFIGDFTDILMEAPNKTSGAPKRKKGMGNPFHDKDDGKFAGVSRHASEGGGSWAIKKTKLKFTGKGKTKEGGLLGKYGATKHPCGRAARAKGKDIRCWDGNKGAGIRVAKAMKKKKKKEDVSMSDLSLIVEMRDLYRDRVLG